MKIPEHDIIDVKWLIARASFAAKPREEERRQAADELVNELAELNGLHGVAIEKKDGGLRVLIPGGLETHVSYLDGNFLISRSGKEDKAPVSYDAGLKYYVGPVIRDAEPGRNGQRPRVAALVALAAAMLGDIAEPGVKMSRPISLRGDSVGG